MELNPQIIKKDGQNEFVILPYEEFLQIQQALEDFEDLVDLRKAKSDTINEQSVPFYEVEKRVKSRNKKE